MRGGFVVRLTSLALVLSLLLGCTRERTVEGPPTVPLSGKIEFTKGGTAKDLADASISVEFQSVEQPEVKAFGIILDDGTFTMKTQVGDLSKEGVIAGTHRVRLNADDSGARYIASKFLNYATAGITIKAPAEGEVIIKVFQ